MVADPGEGVRPICICDQSDICISCDLILYPSSLCPIEATMLGRKVLLTRVCNSSNFLARVVFVFVFVFVFIYVFVF